MSDLKGLLTIVHHPSRDTGHLVMASSSFPGGGCGDILSHPSTRSTLIPSPAPQTSAVTGIHGRGINQVKHPQFRLLESRRSRILKHSV